MWSVKNESNTTPFKNVTRSSEDSTSFFIIINVNFLQEISFAVFLSHLEQLRLKWVVLARQSKLSGGLLQRKSYPSMGTKRLSVYPARSCLLKRSAQHNVFNQPRKLSCWKRKKPTWRGYASWGMICSGGNPPSDNFQIEVISLIDFSIFFLVGPRRLMSRKTSFEVLRRQCDLDRLLDS